MSGSGTPSRNLIVLTVLEAENMRKKDWLGNNDPYCVVTLDSQRHRTRVLWGDKHPQWNEQFQLAVGSASTVVSFSVWDKDRLWKDDFLGLVNVSLAHLEDGSVVEQWYDLAKRSRKSKVSGRLRLRLQLLPAGMSLQASTNSNNSGSLPAAHEPAESHKSNNNNSKASPTVQQLKMSLGNASPDYPHQEPEPVNLPAAAVVPSLMLSVDEYGSPLRGKDTMDDAEIERQVQEAQELRAKMEQDEAEFLAWVATVPQCQLCNAGARPMNDEPLSLQTPITVCVLSDGSSSGVCSHAVCVDCLMAHASQRITKPPIRCPVDGCSCEVPEWALQRALPREAFNRFLDHQLDMVVMACDDLFKCPNKACGVVMERMAQADDELDMETPVRTAEGLPVKGEAREHWARHRYRCRFCTTEFCADCMVMPYHAGYTCAGWGEYLESRHCRFCKSRLPKDAPLDAEIDACNAAECQERARLCCTEELMCGHACNGVRDEEEHLPCLLADCPGHEYSGCEQTGDDYCNICWVEDLDSAPSVRLECGHVFHSQCVKQKLDGGYNGPRITFGFAACPLCKKRIKHPSVAAHIKEIDLLHDKVEAKAIARLTYEKLEKDEHITSPTSPFYQKPKEYAIDRFSYYMCSKCKEPYFAGQRVCGGADGAAAAPFNADELVCGACTGGALGEECPKHGKEHMFFKCQFCCSVGTWFCWGTTHFCDKCHKIQLGGRYLNRLPQSALPQCPGKAQCPLGIEHPPNGEAYALGCTVCSNEATF